VVRVLDPLGLVSLLVVHAKILIEVLWTMSFGWDKPIAHEICFQGKVWFLELKEIKVSWNRRDPEGEKSSFIHTFVDTSNDAYGAVSYPRCEYNQGYYTLDHCVKDESCPFKSHNYTASGIYGSNSQFEANLVNLRSLEHSDDHCTFVVKNCGCFIPDPWQMKRI